MPRVCYLFCSICSCLNVYRFIFCNGLSYYTYISEQAPLAQNYHLLFEKILLTKILKIPVGNKLDLPQPLHLSVEKVSMYLKKCAFNLERIKLIQEVVTLCINFLNYNNIHFVYSLMMFIKNYDSSFDLLDYSN